MPGVAWAAALQLRRSASTLSAVAPGFSHCTVEQPARSRKQSHFFMSTSFPREEMLACGFCRAERYAGNEGDTETAEWMTPTPGFRRCRCRQRRQGVRDLGGRTLDRGFRLVRSRPGLPAARAILVRVDPGEFRAEEKDLRGVVDPQHEDDERPGRTEARRHAALAEVKADQQLAHREEDGGDR